MVTDNVDVHCDNSVVLKEEQRSKWCEMASNATNSTTHELSPNIPYMACEILVAVCAVIGNALVILVFCRERRLRRRTNYYIVSLAIADLLVGLLGIPFAILASLGLPTNLHACLFTVSLLVVLCTISIFCLVAVSVDRYWAILHPMGYSRNVRTKTAIGECVVYPKRRNMGRCVSEICGSHVGKDGSVVLGYYAVWICRQVTTFRRNVSR